MANCCCENRKIDLNTCNISLAIRASKVANRTWLSATINLKVSAKLEPRGDDVVDFKYRFQ